MNNFGIKISKKGELVANGPLNELLFHSGYPILKMYGLYKSSMTYTKDNGMSDFLLLTHNLGYIPRLKMMMQWWDIDSASLKSDFRRVPVIDSLVGGSIYFKARPYATSSEVRMSIGSYDGSGISNVTLDFVLTVYYDEDE